MKAIAEDRFDVYFAEKFWEMIPEIYRHEDGLANPPDVLRSIVEVMAQQAALLRRSQDRLWEDQFIELCNNWAVPYLADLLGTRLISALNERGRRVDVAKTIYYRRRKGTLRILEELISDISGWEGKVVENFRRLGRARHGLDPHPAPLASPLSKSMPGGWADLRRATASELVNGPFDEYFHTPDMRRHRGNNGRYGIPKLAFHLYRLKAYQVVDATPFSLGDNERFTFDPSGRDIPLFIRRNRPDDYEWDEWSSAREWALPGPIRCRLLGHAEYRITEAVVQLLETSPGLSPAASTDLRSLRQWYFENEARLRQVLGTLASNAELLGGVVFPSLLRAALVENCGKNALLPATLAEEASLYVHDDNPDIVPYQVIQAGQLANWAANAASNIRLVIDSERGRFFFPGATVSELLVMYHYGFSGEVGAGTYDRRAVEDCEPTVPEISGGGAIAFTVNEVNQISDSRTYFLNGGILGIQEMVIQAANQQRPYLRLQADLTLQTLPVPPDRDALLTLEGLWIGSEGTHEIVIDGDYECVVISHCTLDPGGVDVEGNPIHPVRLVIEGTVENMVIDACITGPIFTRGTGLVENLTIQDSIIQSLDGLIPAIETSAGGINMDRTTVFGSIDVHRLWASETLITGTSEVLDTQNGCFRFSAAPSSSRLPQPYESFLFTTDNRHWFTSRRFGQPGYAQLSSTAPESLSRGAENGSEIGAFSALVNPIKLDSLRAKVEEYMPFGLIPIFINET